MVNDLHCNFENLDPDWTYLKDQGVLLLNSALTVCEGKSNSHAKFWQKITDKIIHRIGDYFSKVVYIALGNFAIKKLNVINCEKNLLIKCAHPSPLSARLFFGSKPFSKCNQYLGERTISFVAYQ